LATTGIDRYSYFVDALNPAKVIQAMLEAHAVMVPDPDPCTTTIKYALLCLGCTAVAVGLPLAILRKIRHDANMADASRASGKRPWKSSAGPETPPKKRGYERNLTGYDYHAACREEMEDNIASVGRGGKPMKPILYPLRRSERGPALEQIIDLESD